MRPPRPQPDPAPAPEQDARLPGARHSDVVPAGTAHPTWAERGFKLADETRAVWRDAYEAGFERALRESDRGDWLVPLLYAGGHNDARFARGLLQFAYEVTLRVPDADAALAVLEVAEATLAGTIDKELCVRIADNSIDEAYARFGQDRRFDRYFIAHCAAAVARVTARAPHPDSAREAIDAIQSAAKALAARGDADAERDTRRLAARHLRDALGELAAPAPPKGAA